MKKKLPAIMIIVLLVSTVLFYGLWQHEKSSQADIKRLCLAEAALAAQGFSDFQTSGAESDYWHAVADFRGFEQAYYVLIEDTDSRSNYTYCNELYACLVFYPARSQAHIDEIMTVMKSLAVDLADDAAFLKMANLRNSINE